MADFWLILQMREAVLRNNEVGRVVEEGNAKEGIQSWVVVMVVLGTGRLLDSEPLLLDHRRLLLFLRAFMSKVVLRLVC